MKKFGLFIIWILLLGAYFMFGTNNDNQNELNSWDSFDTQWVPLDQCWTILDIDVNNTQNQLNFCYESRLDYYNENYNSPSEACDAYSNSGDRDDTCWQFYWSISNCESIMAQGPNYEEPSDLYEAICDNVGENLRNERCGQWYGDFDNCENIVEQAPNYPSVETDDYLCDETWISYFWTVAYQIRESDNGTIEWLDRDEFLERITINWWEFDWEISCDLAECHDWIDNTACDTDPYYWNLCWILTLWNQSHIDDLWQSNDDINNAIDNYSTLWGLTNQWNDCCDPDFVNRLNQNDSNIWNINNSSTPYVRNDQFDRNGNDVDSANEYLNLYCEQLSACEDNGLPIEFDDPFECSEHCGGTQPCGWVTIDTNSWPVNKYICTDCEYFDDNHVLDLYPYFLEVCGVPFESLEEHDHNAIDWNNWNNNSWLSLSKVQDNSQEFDGMTYAEAHNSTNSWLYCPHEWESNYDINACEEWRYDTITECNENCPWTCGQITSQFTVYACSACDPDDGSDYHLWTDRCHNGYDPDVDGCNIWEDCYDPCQMHQRWNCTQQGWLQMVNSYNPSETCSQQDEHFTNDTCSINVPSGDTPSDVGIECNPTNVVHGMERTCLSGERYLDPNHICNSNPNSTMNVPDFYDINGNPRPELVWYLPGQGSDNEGEYTYTYLHNGSSCLNADISLWLEDENLTPSDLFKFSDEFDTEYSFGNWECKEHQEEPTIRQYECVPVADGWGEWILSWQPPHGNAVYCTDNNANDVTNVSAGQFSGWSHCFNVDPRDPDAVQALNDTNCCIWPTDVTPKYRCNGSTCVRDDVNGTTTSSNCNNSCWGTGILPKYRCNGSTCVRDDVNGTTTSSNCNNSCQSNTIYCGSCSWNTCVQSPTTATSCPVNAYSCSTNNDCFQVIQWCTDLRANNYWEAWACTFNGCVAQQCQTNLTSPNSTFCNNNSECINPVCNANVSITKTDESTCNAENGWLNVVVAWVDSATVTVECSDGTFTTQQYLTADAYLPIVWGTCDGDYAENWERVSDMLWADAWTFCAEMVDAETTMYMARRIAGMMWTSENFAYEMLVNCCGSDGITWVSTADVISAWSITDTTGHVWENPYNMHGCSMAATCPEWIAFFDHDVSQEYGIRVYDSAWNIVGQWIAPISTASQNTVTWPWLQTPVPGPLTMKICTVVNGVINAADECKTMPNEVMAPTSCGSCSNVFENVLPSSICEWSTRVIYNDCGDSRTIVGTSTTWECACDSTFVAIDPNTICTGGTRTIFNECGDVRVIQWTRDCASCNATSTTVTKNFPNLEPWVCTITVSYTSSTCKDCEETFQRTIAEAPCAEQCDTIDHDGDGNPYNGFDRPGTGCDDNNPLTIDDKVNNNCVCRWTPVVPVDCVPSPWTPWVCDSTTWKETRTRSVITEAAYWWEECDPLDDERTCNVDRYDLALNKLLYNGAATSFKAWDPVAFVINVVNQWDIPASWVEVTDYIPNWLTLDWASIAHTMNWANKAVFTIPGTIQPGQSYSFVVNFVIDQSFAGLVIRNYAEISKDDGEDCDSTPDDTFNNDGTPVDNDLWNGCNPWGDEDDHDVELIRLEICNGRDDNNDWTIDEGFEHMSPWTTCNDGNSNTENDMYNNVCVCRGLLVVDEDVYDLALVKNLASGQSRIVAEWDLVTFTVTITNQWDIIANSFTLIDHLPTGLTLEDADWNDFGNNKATYVVTTPLVPGASIDVDITTRVGANVEGTLVNVVEMFEDDGDDIDSDVNNDNWDQSEDEEDPEPITVVNAEICDGQDNDNDGVVDEGFEDMAPGRVCNDGNATTMNDKYNSVCVCTWTPVEYDLALVKDLASGQSRNVTQGDLVTFTVTVTNQGNVTANSFELIDHLPTWLTLLDNDWTSIGNNEATYVVNTPLAPWNSMQVDITTKVGANIEGTIINVVEILEDDGDDIDSDVNNDDGDQSEDEEDPEPITVAPLKVEICDGQDNDDDGDIDEWFEDMSVWKSCDDWDPRTLWDMYNSVCVCAWVRPTWWSRGWNNYCGDWNVRTGEECDDGNYTDWDWCDSNCKVEWICGDWVMNQDSEQCDDGNLDNYDGCSSTCLVEVILTCGDWSMNQEWEECDDGNTFDGDDCSSTCQIELDDDIIDLILEKKKAPVFVPPQPERIVTPLILPKTGGEINYCPIS